MAKQSKTLKLLDHTEKRFASVASLHYVPLKMTTLIYDSTFEGLMTAVFEVFEYKYDVDRGKL